MLRKEAFLLLLLSPLVYCGSYQLSIFFYHYEVNSSGFCDSSEVDIKVDIVNGTNGGNLSIPMTPTTLNSSHLCHFQIGFDQRLNGSNPVVLDYNSNTGMEMFIKINFNKKSSDTSIILISLRNESSLRLHGNFTKRHRYSSFDADLLSLDLSIQINCSRNMEGDKCDKPVTQPLLSSLGRKLIPILGILIAILLIVSVAVTILCVFSMRVAVSAKANCKPVWFNRYFIDPKASRRETIDPEGGGTTKRSRRQTRLTLINGSLYFWKSAGSKKKKKKSSSLEKDNKQEGLTDLAEAAQSKESKNIDESPDVIINSHHIYEDEDFDDKKTGEPLSVIVEKSHVYEDEDFDDKKTGEPLSVIVEKSHVYEDEDFDDKKTSEPTIVGNSHVYEDHEVDGTSLMVSHLSGKANEITLLTGKEASETKHQESSSKTNDKKQAAAMPKDPKKKKSNKEAASEKKAKANPKSKPDDKKSKSKADKKKEKKKKKSSKESKELEENSVVQNVAADFEEKRMCESKEPVSVPVHVDMHEKGRTNMATSNPSSEGKRLSKDVRKMIGELESQGVVGSLPQASMTSNSGTTALPGRSTSPKPNKLSRVSVTSDDSDKVLPLSKGGLSPTALPITPTPVKMVAESFPKGVPSSTSSPIRSVSPKPGKPSRVSVISEDGNEIIPLHVGGLSSTALITQPKSPKPGKITENGLKGGPSAISLPIRSVSPKPGNPSRVSVISENGDEVIPLNKGGLSSTALLGQSPSPKQSTPISANDSSKVFHFPKGGSSSTALQCRSPSPKPGNTSECRGKGILSSPGGGLSSTALLERPSSPMPGKQVPLGSSALDGRSPSPKPDTKESRLTSSLPTGISAAKKEGSRDTLGQRVRASIARAISGQRKSLDLEEMEKKIRENAKSKHTKEKLQGGSPNNHNKKKDKKISKGAIMMGDEDQEGYVDVDIQPNSKIQEDEVVGKDGYVDIKTIARRKTERSAESSHYDDGKDGYVPVETEQSQKISATKKGKDDIKTVPNKAYEMKKFDSAAPLDAASGYVLVETEQSQKISATEKGKDDIKTVPNKAYGMEKFGSAAPPNAASRFSTPDGDSPYEYVRDQSIIKFRKKK